MKKLLLLLPLFAFFAACKGDDDMTNTQAEIGVNFQAVYDGVRLEKNKNYPFDGYNLQFTRFHTFVSDVELLKADGSSVLLSEIEFVDFTPDDATNDLSAVPHFHFNNLPQGTYTGLRMGIGVKPGLNGKGPNSYPVGNPLYQETEYWSGWKSYIFTKTEGALDTLNNGVYNLQFSYHTGIDDLYRTVNLPKNIKIIDGQTTELIIEVDINELLDGKSGAIDPRKNQNAHSLNNKPIALIISNNYQTALKVK
jgi:hypothetical protein